MNERAQKDNRKDQYIYIKWNIVKLWIFHGIVFSLKKGHRVIGDNMEEPGMHYAK